MEFSNIIIKGSQQFFIALRFCMINVILFMTTTPFYGPNIIVILESEWGNKNGWVKGRGMGLYLEKNNALFNPNPHDVSE